MKKDSIRSILVAAIILIAYHLVVFVAPFPFSDVFWISYGFTLVSFAVAAASIYIAFGKASAKSKFYGFPIAKIGVTYAAAQLVVGMVAMIIGAIIPGWIAVIVYSLALCAAALGLISTEAVRDGIEIQDKKLKEDTALMNDLRTKVNQMANQCDNSDAAKALRRFSEEIRFSDPVSNPALKEIEADLSAAVYQLQDAVVDGDSAVVCELCNKAILTLAERNRLCKLNKD